MRFFTHFSFFILLFVLYADKILKSEFATILTINKTKEKLNNEK